MTGYTLGLFANMYPAFEGDYRGIFIRQMVLDLESRDIIVRKAVKTSSSVWGYLPFYYRSLLLARDPQPDLFQAEYIPHSSLVPAFFRRSGTPLVLKFHGDDARIYPFRNRCTLAVTRTMLSRADHVVTASEEMKRILTGIGADPSRISAIHTGVDTGFFMPGSRQESRMLLNLPEHVTVFLFVGRLHPSKGIHELLEAARLCPDFRFIIAGPGTVPLHPDNCTFVGAKPPGEIRLLLNAADCLVLPTHTDAVPAVVMEAFACGIPAITTNVGGCPEIVDHTRNGLLVPLGDVPALHAAIVWMHDHPAEREEMGRKGRLMVEERYDHGVLIEKLISVHRRLLSGN